MIIREFYNFPLLKTFDIDLKIVTFLDKKFEEYKIERYDHQIKTFNHNGTGYRTGNLLVWENEEYKNFIKTTLTDIFSEQIGLNKENIELSWNHMIYYGSGGSMNLQKHSHNEDFALFIYLDSCSDGQTAFYLNDYNKESFLRSEFAVTPRKGLSACFSSLLLHQGLFSDQGKKMFIAGMRIK